MIDEGGDDILREPQSHEPQPRPDIAQDPCDADDGWVDVVVRSRRADSAPAESRGADQKYTDRRELQLLIATPLALFGIALLVSGVLWLWRVVVAVWL